MKIKTVIELHKNHIYGYEGGFSFIILGLLTENEKEELNKEFNVIGEKEVYLIEYNKYLFSSDLKLLKKHMKEAYDVIKQKLLSKINTKEYEFENEEILEILE